MFVKSVNFVNSIIPFEKGENFEFRSLTAMVGGQGMGKSTMLELLMNNMEYPSSSQLLLIYEMMTELFGDTINTSEIGGKSLASLASMVKLTNNTSSAFKTPGLLPSKDFEEKEVPLWVLMGREKATQSIMAILVNPEMRFCEVQRTDNIMESYLYHSPEKHNPRHVTGMHQLSDSGPILDFFGYMAEREFDNDAMQEIYQHFKEYELERCNNRFKAKKINVSEMDVLTSQMKSHGQVLLPLIKQLTEPSNGLVFVDEPETALSIKSQHIIANALLDCVSRGCQVFVATHSSIIMTACKEVLSLEHRRWMSSEEFIESQK